MDVIVSVLVKILCGTDRNQRGAVCTCCQPETTYHIRMPMCIILFVAAWVVRSKAATVRYFWITHSCLI